MTGIDQVTILRIAKRRRFSAETVEIAKRLFVDGEKPIALATEYQLKSQRIYAIRRQFLEAARDEGLPSGWVRETFEGPRGVVQRLRAELDRAVAEATARRGRPARQPKLKPALPSERSGVSRTPGRKRA